MEEKKDQPCSDFVFQKVPETLNFAEAELEILSYWEEKSAFETSVAVSAGRPNFLFMMDVCVWRCFLGSNKNPLILPFFFSFSSLFLFVVAPFATGLPHYGHLLAGTIKVFPASFCCIYLSKLANKKRSSRFLLPFTFFVLQDIVTRYAHQSGFHVLRRFGWDW